MDIDLMMSVVWWSSGITSHINTLLSLLIEGALCWCLAAAAVGLGMYLASSCNGFCFMAIYKLFWYRFVIFVPST